jgi:hypothetical protein
MNPNDVTSIPTRHPALAAPAPEPPKPAEDDRAARLARARKGAEERAKAAKQAQEDAEIERHELIERLEKEHGKEGHGFALIDCTDVGEGFVAVKLGPDVYFSTYKASKMGVEETDAFVAPLLAHPSIDQYHRITGRRPHVADRCAITLARLYGFRADEVAGK